MIRTTAYARGAGGSAARQDELTIATAGRTVSGWQAIRVTRGAERLPSDFDVIASESEPGDPKKIVLAPGDAVEVRLGGDLVMTGYVDRWGGQIAPNGHTVRIRGRSKCADLVDCSAVVTTMQLQFTNVRRLAEALAGRFGVKVKVLSGDGPPLQTIGIALTETPFDVIERCARWSEFLVYDDPEGNLVLARSGATKMASGIAQGVNVQAASVEFSMDERFSEIISVINSTDPLQQLADPGPGGVSPGNLIWTEKDLTVPRYRPHVVVAEQGLMALDIAEKRAKWEVARRYGRSQAVRVTIDSWRDAAGKLWEPNALIPVDLPALKIENRQWVIGEVSFLRSLEAGTTAELVVMPKEAFEPQPVVLYSFDWQVEQAIRQGAGVGGAGAP
jgi:prophage tail gpP-like protein